MTSFAGHPQAMLTEIYIEDLMVDEELADRVWEAWNAGEIDDQRAWLASRPVLPRNLFPVLFGLPAALAPFFDTRIGSTVTFSVWTS